VKIYQDVNKTFAGMAFVIQRSSVFTSAITPLIGESFLLDEQVEHMGKNVSKVKFNHVLSLMMLGTSSLCAMCHFIFNVLSILLWYPVPLSRLPICMARFLGEWTSKYRLFAVLYLILCFPGSGGYLCTVFCCSPLLLPWQLQTWDHLPLWMHSLKQVDNIITRVTLCCRETRNNDQSYTSPEDLPQLTEYEAEKNLVPLAHNSPALIYSYETETGAVFDSLNGKSSRL
uniref:Sodium-dependent phosphate transport protein 2A n=1 Tax=Cyprinus carpio TaxID=7962 RepID=A0A8C1MRE5_CYPCA